MQLSAPDVLEVDASCGSRLLTSKLQGKGSRGVPSCERGVVTLSRESQQNVVLSVLQVSSSLKLRILEGEGCWNVLDC